MSEQNTPICRDCKWCRPYIFTPLSGRLDECRWGVRVTNPVTGISTLKRTTDFAELSRNWEHECGPSGSRFEQRIFLWPKHLPRWTAYVVLVAVGIFAVVIWP